MDTSVLSKIVIRTSENIANVMVKIHAVVKHDTEVLRLSNDHNLISGFTDVCLGVLM